MAQLSGLEGPVDAIETPTDEFAAFVMRDDIGLVVDDAVQNHIGDGICFQVAALQTANLDWARNRQREAASAMQSLYTGGAKLPTEPDPSRLPERRAGQSAEARERVAQVRRSSQ